MPDWESLLGKLIGSGGRRNVYEHKDNPEWVIKKNLRPSKPYNQNEYDTYKMIEAHLPELLVWIVPVVSVSDDYIYLVQERGEYCPAPDVPKQTLVPKVLRADCVGNKNWVLHGGRPKLCDYDHAQHRNLKNYLKAVLEEEEFVRGKGV